MYDAMFCVIVQYMKMSATLTRLDLVYLARRHCGFN